MGFFDRLAKGLSNSRNKFKEQMNILLDRGPNLDEDFWEALEETLILSDIGGAAAYDIVENLRDQARRQALPDAYAVLDLLNDQITATFTPGGEEILESEQAVVLFVGINGTGKTTTVGKIAKEYTDAGRKVILGSADTFRAAAIEQLEVWAQRAQVEMVTRERGSDPASVCYETIERAEEVGADLILIDTAGRLHTSDDLMRELGKVVNVVRKRSNMPVYTVLVIDATTGQNGMQQAREFNRALNLDALIITKLDGTAKGGIALAVSHELKLPIIKIGVGEGIEDLRNFNARDFSSALIGDFDDRYEEAYEDNEPVSAIPSTPSAATDSPSAAKESPSDDTDFSSAAKESPSDDTDSPSAAKESPSDDTDFSSANPNTPSVSLDSSSVILSEAKDPALLDDSHSQTVLGTTEESFAEELEEVVEDREFATEEELAELHDEEVEEAVEVVEEVIERKSGKKHFWEKWF